MASTRLRTTSRTSFSSNPLNFYLIPRAISYPESKWDNIRSNMADSSQPSSSAATPPSADSGVVTANSAHDAAPASSGCGPVPAWDSGVRSVCFCCSARRSYDFSRPHTKVAIRYSTVSFLWLVFQCNLIYVRRRTCLDCQMVDTRRSTWRIW